MTKKCWGEAGLAPHYAPFQWITQIIPWQTHSERWYICTMFIFREAC